MLYIGNVASALMQLSSRRYRSRAFYRQYVSGQWPELTQDTTTSLSPAKSECIKQSVQTMLVSVYLSNPAANLANLEDPLTLAVPVETHNLVAQSHQ